MILEELLKKIDHTCERGNVSREISGVVYDSRKITKDCVYICIEGANFDGHTAALIACEKGAAAVVAKASKEVEMSGDTALIRVEDTRYALAHISAAWFGYPAEKMTVIGITGTKGKTTTSCLIKDILDRSGIRTGLIGTIEVIIGDEHIPAFNTTPESYIIQEYFRKMVDRGIKVAVMEVSSQGLMMNRTAAIDFDIGVFTNIEPDHIGPNEHKDFDDYLRCKSLLFRQCRKGIFNLDDPHIERILEGHTCEVETFGVKECEDGRRADIYSENEEYIKRDGKPGVTFDVSGLVNMKVFIDIPGLFSVYNTLCAIAVCRHFNVTLEVMKEVFAKASVKGRIELVDISPLYSLMIDYAHNAMALESLLTTLKLYDPKRLVCVFGCGGNRSKSRRFEMGEVSGRLSDLTVITSDNPRFEEPLDIIADIRTGIEKTDGKFIEIPDRREAIKYAIENAEEGDIIVLAGKGHEDYQEIKGVKYPMDERVLIKEILEELREKDK